MDENQEDKNGAKVIRLSKRKFRFLLVILIIVAVYFLSKGSLNVMRTGSFNNYALENVKTGVYQDVVIMAPSYHGGMGEISIDTDDREFIKTSYSSNFKTRDVSKLVNDIKNVVKGSDGRIDRLNSSPKNGYVQFVVAKSKFDSFRNEIESLAHKKLYSESISSENLLSEKISIEDQTTNIEIRLASLISQKEILKNNHDKKVSSINKELAKITSELISIRAAIAVSVEQNAIDTLKIQESSLIAQQTNQNKLLTNENNNYNRDNKNLENQINRENNNLVNINKVDDKFTDKIETVSGHISVNWVSNWQLAKIFSPIHPTLIIIILIIIILIALKKKNLLPVIIWQ
jgi:hypothetical protein